MTLPFGMSSLCMQLLWAFIVFLTSRGYNLAHGYFISDNADVSRHFNSGPSMRWDGDTSKTRQSFVFTPHQVHTENNEDVGSVTSLREETMPNKPNSGDEPDEFSVESPSNQHHYGLLVKKDKQTNSGEGVSFPTIRAFKQFIETMKSSFLIPGSDLRIYFQTARQIMENEVAQNMKRGPEMSNRSQSAEDEDDASLNEVWSEPTNAASEESEQGSSFQIPSDNLPVLNPADLTSVYDQHQSGQGSALYPAPHSAATEHVWDNHGSFESAGISLKNTNTQDEDIQSTSYNLPEQIPSGSFFREEFSPRGHKTAPNINLLNRSPQDFSSARTPMVPEENMQLSMYAPQSKGSLSVIQKTSGASRPRHFQSEKQRGGTPADILLASQVPSLNSYSKTSGSGLRPRLYSPVAHLHVSSGSLPSSSDMAAQTSSPHDAQDQTFNNKQPFRSHQLITSQHSGSLQGSGRDDDYLRDQTDRVTAWSFLDNQEKEGPFGGLSEPPEQNQILAVQEFPQQTENIQKVISGRYSSNYDVRSPLAKADYTSFKSLATAPTSASDTPLSGLITNKIMSRNLWMKNVRPDQFPSDDVSLGRYTLGSFLTPKRRHMSPKRGNVNAASTGFPEKFRRRTRPNMHPNEPRGFFRRNWGNTFHSLKGIHKSTPSVKAYVVKSRRDYVRSKALQSNTRYQLDGKNW